MSSLPSEGEHGREKKSWDTARRWQITPAVPLLFQVCRHKCVFAREVGDFLLLREFLAVWQVRATGTAADPADGRVNHVNGFALRRLHERPFVCFACGFNHAPASHPPSPPQGASGCGSASDPGGLRLCVVLKAGVLGGGGPFHISVTSHSLGALNVYLHQGLFFILRGRCLARTAKGFKEINSTWEMCLILGARYCLRPGLEGKNYFSKGLLDVTCTGRSHTKLHVMNMER